MLTYNRAEHIGDSIRSILNQSYENLELVINDDKSTDNTEKICKEFEKKDERVKYYRNSENVGYAENNNLAIERANYEKVGLVHDGDIYHKHLVQKWVEQISADDDIAIVFQGHRRRGADRILNFSGIIDGQKLLDKMLRQWGSPIFGIAMVRKTYVQNLGGFDPVFPRRSDVDMWMRLLNHYDAAYIDEALIDIAPREDNHDLKGISWEYVRNLSNIRRININRRYKYDPKTLNKYMNKFHKDRRKKYCKMILRAFIKMKWSKVREGFKVLSNLDSF
ncbi:glycosyltransferase family 2 protein [Salinibacter ruber]|uniref:glycosyltransferase family 2 protein n=1 Tax=Salinibacter ruber TaxID=146919 RepID=UPI00216A10FF|nr:glycosyltransferase family A protein [Salinibacter ruber]MCS4058443.1 glycosyltransferase involved in cell wall biosynthesis [Salinibacter ruber]